MDAILTQLRAAAEPTRLRILALAARGSFCVSEYTEILAQSQPSLSRHLRLLGEAGLLLREREGTNVWFTLPVGRQGGLIESLLSALPADDPLLEADRRAAARVLAERARAASAHFRQASVGWNEAAALDLPTDLVDAAILRLLPTRIGSLLDIGTGTARLLELTACRADRSLGIDASRQMLALARVRLSSQRYAHCAVRQADMYNLPLADHSFDAVVLQMVLHYAEDPASVLREAARVLSPGGTLLLVELAHHANDAIATQLAHRWLGFGTEDLRGFMAEAGLVASDIVTLPAHPDVLVMTAHPLPATAADRMDAAAVWATAP
jgi:ArsR family transcriptional regulator